MNENRCETSEVAVSEDLLAQASITGRIHARRGARCVVDTATRLYGERVAKAYEAGYRREIARSGTETAA
jgi:hypothetical protein